MTGLILVLKTALCGACAVIAWDMAMAWRASWKLKGFFGAVLDFASPLLCVTVLWLGVLYIMDGSTRMYVFLCMGAGALLYILTIRGWIFKLFFEVFKDINKIIRFIFKILLTPARFLYKMIYVELYIKRRRRSAETEKTANDPKN